MKAARLTGAKSIVLEEIPIPEISDEEVLVEVKYCGICGTDLHDFKDPGFAPSGAYMGHEFSGVVARTGSRVEGWKPGDRVVVKPIFRCGECYACRRGFWECCERAMEAISVSADAKLPGAFARYVRVPYPEQRLHRLPPEISFEVGALVEPLATSLHAVRISSFRPGDQAMVLGCGPIGLGVIAFLKNSGAGLIIATEVNATRAEAARHLGADYVFNPQAVSDLSQEVLRLTNGLGANQAFECSGATQALQSAPGYLRAWGQIVLVSVINHEVPIVPFDFQPREIQLQPCFCYGDEFPMVIDFLRKSSVPIGEIISSKISLSEIVEKGFNVLIRPGNQEIKIIVAPDV